MNFRDFEERLLGIAPCWGCRKMFAFNPDRVPSIYDGNGVRRPVCRDCMDKANEIRAKHELDPLPILDGAYPDE